MIDWVQDQLSEKTLLSFGVTSGAITMSDILEFGWRIVTGCIFLIMFYFHWRKHRREELEHRKKLEEWEQRIAQSIKQSKEFVN